jgi:hypothetical protein
MAKQRELTGTSDGILQRDREEAAESGAGVSAPAEAKPRRKPNPTVRAIQSVLEILEPLDLERRRRVLACVLDELGVQVCRAVPVDPPAHHGSLSMGNDVVTAHGMRPSPSGYVPPDPKRIVIGEKEISRPSEGETR